MSIAPIGGAAATTPEAPRGTTDATKAGEGFERMLLGQLTKELVDSALPSDQAASAATGAYKQMLPDALTEALMSGGGIGLAQQLAAATKASTS
jgi:Rod binding domain-containing protein